MKLVEKHIIKKGHKYFEEIDKLSFASKNLYNLANYHIRQEFFKTGKILSYPKLDKLLQSTDAYKALPAKVSQQVLMILARNWKAFMEAEIAYTKNPEKFNSKPKIPKYKHKQTGRNILIYTIQALKKPELRNGIVAPSKNQIKVFTRQNEIHQIRIVPRPEHYVIEIVYEHEDVSMLLDNGNVAGVDIGLNNLAAVTSNKAGFEPFLVNGRPIKSINAYYNKKKAKLQSSLPKDQKSSRRIKKLTNKRNRQIDNYLHNASKYLIQRLSSEGVTTIIIGKNERWKQNINIGKTNNQNFVFIPHARFVSQLQYKAQLAGIQVIITEESYTSKCSFLDNEPICKHESYLGKRIHRGLFRSAQGIFINADINGSANIVRKVFPNVHSDGIQGIVVYPVRIAPYKLAK